MFWLLIKKKVKDDTIINMPNGFLFWLLLLFLSNVEGLSYPASLTNPYLIPPIPGLPSISQYLIFHGSLRSNYTQARAKCVDLGGDLADIDSVRLLEYLTARLHEPAFILGFLGDSLNENCGAIYPGAAVAIPWDGCFSILDYICEVPISEYFITNPSTRDNNVTKTHVDIYVRPHGFLQYQGQVKNDIVTETVNIAGAIATNPVLPCCKCC